MGAEVAVVSAKGGRAALGGCSPLVMPLPHRPTITSCGNSGAHGQQMSDSFIGCGEGGGPFATGLISPAGLETVPSATHTWRQTAHDETSEIGVCGRLWRSARGQNVDRIRTSANRSGRALGRVYSEEGGRWLARPTALAY